MVNGAGGTRECITQVISSDPWSSKGNIWCYVKIEVYWSEQLWSHSACRFVIFAAMNIASSPDRARRKQH